VGKFGSQSLQSRPSRAAKGVEPLVRIPNEGQAHFCAHVVSLGRRLRPQHGAGIRLRDLVNGEVLRVDVGLQARLEGCTDAPETVPLHAAEEGVLFDFVATT
jgi:hypothetical protein